MEKRKGVDVFKAFDDYSDRECDLLNNPKYEDMSNEEITPLLEANEKILLAALLQDEDETCELLGSCCAFSMLGEFFSPIQEHFHSKKIAKRLNDTLALLEEGKGGDTVMNPNCFPEERKLVDEANKFAE